MFSITIVTDIAHCLSMLHLSGTASSVMMSITIYGRTVCSVTLNITIVTNIVRCMSTLYLSDTASSFMMSITIATDTAHCMFEILTQQ